MTKPIIVIEDYYDGFSIVMLNAETRVEEQRFALNQEESLERLKWVFQTLGFETEYEEIY